MTDNILNIPKKAKLDLKVTYKQIENNVDLLSSEKKRLRESTESINVIGILKESTVGIRKFLSADYNYCEIYIVRVMLKSSKNLDLVQSILHKLFANPIIVILENDNEISLSMNHKRINKLDSEKAVLEENFTTCLFNRVTYSNYIKLFDISKTESENLKVFYSLFCQYVLISEVFDHIDLEKEEQFDRYLGKNNLISELKRLKYTLTTYKEEYRQARTDNEKLPINKMIIKTKAKMKELQVKLKE